MPGPSILADEIARNQAAQALLQDETITAAFEAVKESLNKDLLNAATPADREEKFHEYQGVERVRHTLVQWAGGETVRLNQEIEK